jgi:hypothetical protein
MFATCGEQLDIWDEDRTEPIRSFTWGVDSLHAVKFNPIEVIMYLMRPVCHIFNYLEICLGWSIYTTATFLGQFVTRMNKFIGQSDVKHIMTSSIKTMTSPIKTMTSVLNASTDIIT